jgi:hypothetical protein
MKDPGANERNFSEESLPQYLTIVVIITYNTAVVCLVIVILSIYDAKTIFFHHGDGAFFRPLQNMQNFGLFFNMMTVFFLSRDSYFRRYDVCFNKVWERWTWWQPTAAAASFLSVRHSLLSRFNLTGWAKSLHLFKS